MAARRKKLLFVAATFFVVLVGLGGTWLWYLNHYIHKHCIKQASLALKIYSGEHFGHLPYSTNGFGDALTLFARTDESVLNSICGPDDDGHLFSEALANHSVVPEDKCSRVYIQGLTESDSPDICVLFDRNSCKGGDHGRSPWGHPLREASLLDGSMQIIRDEDWPEFSQKQVELLVAAGFSRTNALHFYPAAE
jgi:hypothetical protein